MAIAGWLWTEFPDEILQSALYQGQVAVVVRPRRIVFFFRWPRTTESIRMDHLRSLCGVDNLRRRESERSRFEVVYNLYSIPLRHEIRVRAELGDQEPVIDSVVKRWPGANWMERETYDLFGIRFNNHPDLRRVLLPDDWVGHPLRKDYPLKGKEEWAGMTELLAKVRELDRFGFTPGRFGHGQAQSGEDEP